VTCYESNLIDHFKFQKGLAVLAYLLIHLMLQIQFHHHDAKAGLDSVDFRAKNIYLALVALILQVQSLLLQCRSAVMG
jgi:SNF family Na+-dependent transporter